MLVLLDQGTPVPLRLFLKGHTVRTAAQQGWSTLPNGDLLRAAEAAGFDVLLTTEVLSSHRRRRPNLRRAFPESDTSAANYARSFL